MARLVTKRLVLRPAQASDLAAMHAILSDPVTLKYWGTPPYTAPSQTAEFLAAMRDADPELSADFIVELDGTPIGKAGFWRFPEVGFALNRDYWGQGYASEFLEALIKYGFETQQLAKITADVDPRNTASIRLLTKFGFVETGRETANLLVGDVWCDSVYFALYNQS